mmetsp:Transcript_128994/g.287324  ORF Transcript_128994/g.287324 Transcript_128994/m.287324 type:complete len:1100 (-) Transcript_128994:212-3511(-)
MEAHKWHEKVVEIHGVDGLVRVWDGPPRFLGKDIDPNGKWGRAQWDEETSWYNVQTFDGLLMTIEDKYLREHVRAGPEVGGSDLRWSEDDDFGAAVCEIMWRKGCCLIELPDSEEWRGRAVAEAQQRSDYALFPSQVEELYLGRSGQSKVAWLGQGEGEGELALKDGASPSSEALDHFGAYTASLAQAIASETPEYFGFLPSGQSGTMLRVPLASEAEREELSPGPLDENSVEDGTVAEYLRFIQQRRLCMMCFVDSEGSVELTPRADSTWSWDAVKLHVKPDRLLIFRNDVMSYTYLAKGPSARCVMLQSWFLQEPEEIEIQRVNGEVGALERAMENGPPAHVPGEQVHIMGMNIRCGGQCWNKQENRYAWELNLDGSICFPLHRWDYEPYWDPNPEAWMPKAKCRHAAMLGEDMVTCFDNDFFGISDDMAAAMPPDQRIAAESAWEIFNDAGFSLKKLQGSKVRVGVGDSNAGEFDVWHRFQEDPDTWKHAQTINAKGNRIAYHFGLRGGQFTIDTACSASLVSFNTIHQNMLATCDYKMGLSMASGVYTTPFGFIGLSKAGMLGATGRVKFSDQSADGFCRGEGAGGVFMLASSEFEEMHDRYAAALGSYTNQDGRSASLTAPNGPSQQACCRASLRQGLLEADDFSFHENHGTGTALGDPIEIGSVRALFVRRDLDAPISISSTKSHVCHLEGCAGSVTILATIMNCMYASSPANCHLRQGNHHIELQGFPCMFVDEFVGFDRAGSVGGCNSFGFGGTNAHADIWAACWVGGRSKQRKLEISQYDYVSVTCPRCLGPMEHLSKQAVPEGGFEGRHFCNQIRSEFASYDNCSYCYEAEGGSYLYAPPEVLDATDGYDQGYTLFMTGTWSSWRSCDIMTRDSSGSYVGEVTLGGSRVEQFQLRVDEDPNMTLYPVVARGTQTMRILGPGKDREGRGWVIDGRLDKVPVGTVYRVAFQWRGERKSISWEVARLPTSKAIEVAVASKTYFVACSWNKWSELLEMQWEGGSGSKGVFRFRFVIGREGREQFQITEGEDWSMTLHPPRSSKGGDGTACVGPDSNGYGLNWGVAGKPGQAMVITLDLGSKTVAKKVTCEPAD